MSEMCDEAHSRGGSHAPPVYPERRRACMVLPVAVLGLFVLGGVSFAAGERRPWSLPASAGLALKVSGVVAMGTSLVVLAAWGVVAACAHVSAKLSRWLEGARPAIVEMSVFVAAYLLATSQRRRCRRSDDNQALRDSMAEPPPFDLHSDRGETISTEGGGRSEGRHGSAAGSWRWVAGVLFAPASAAASARTGGGRVGPQEVQTSTRTPRERGNKIVPSSP